MSANHSDQTWHGPIRLHIGGTAVREGWKILDIRPGRGVDYVGDCSSLEQFADGSVTEIYAAHVLEHLGYQSALTRALHEMHRVLCAGGLLRVSVPDLEVLCRLFITPGLGHDKRFYVMRMMFGGQIDEHDFHRVGFDWETLRGYLDKAGFREITRVEEFGLFPGDCSSMRFENQLISLNVAARK